MGKSKEHTYGAERLLPPPRFGDGISDMSYQPLGLNGFSRPLEMATRTEPKQLKVRAPKSSPPPPQEELSKHRRSRNISPVTAGSKLSQQSQPQRDHDHGTLQLGSTPNRQRMGAFRSPSLESSITSSPSVWSPSGLASSQTSITPNTTLPPSLEGSPPYSHPDVRGKKRSSQDIDPDPGGLRSSKRVAIMSPGSVVEAVKGRLADEIDHRRPEPLTSSLRASSVQAPPTIQASPTPAKVAEREHLEVIRDAASDPSAVPQVDRADAPSMLPESSESISNCGSDRSPTDEEGPIDSDWDYISPEADANNDQIFWSFGGFGC